MTNHLITIFTQDGKTTDVDLAAFGKEGITFGSGEGCDIVLNAEGVSPYQGYFYIINGACQIFDNSGQGALYINNVQAAAHALSDGDSIKIYDKDIGGQSILIVYSNKNVDTEEWKICRLDVAKNILIGRDKTCHIVLGSMGVGATHAAIQKKGEQYVLQSYIFDSIMVNHYPVHEACMLKQKDVIQIGTAKIVIIGDSILYRTSQIGISLEAIGVNKIVSGKKGPRKIVNDVSFKVNPGEFVAIIGGSGAGKSSVLGCVSGYSKITSGHVYVEGQDLESNFQTLKNLIGFVPQKDIVHEDLTLRKLLEYASFLRMPKDVSRADRVARIKEITDIVALNGREDTLVKRLSGGEKKRASMAVELLSDPGLFFLDEPTSGLDPGTERSIMITLRKMATKGRTVVLVTHNPMNLNLCDKIIFLGRGGNLCYCGSPSEALTFFGVDNFVDIYNIVSADPEGWRQKFAEANSTTPIKQQEARGGGAVPKKHGFVRQFAVLFKRYMNTIVNNRAFVVSALLQAPLITIFISLVAGEDLFNVYDRTRAILFALVCANIWLGLLNSIQEICKERVILKREYLSGLKLSSYILSKICVQGLICFVQSLLLIGIFALLNGVPTQAILFGNAFVELLIAAVIISFTAAAMGLLCSAIASTPEVAMTVAPLLLVPQLLFSGILFELKGVTQFISNVVISRWGMEAYGSIVNLNGLPLALSKRFPGINKSFEEFFEFSSRHLINTWGTLLLLSVICIIACVIALKRSMRIK